MSEPEPQQYQQQFIDLGNGWKKLVECEQEWLARPDIWAFTLLDEPTRSRKRPEAGYRCHNTACSVSVVVVEADGTTLLLPRTPHRGHDAWCPFCGALMKLGSTSKW